MNNDEPTEMPVSELGLGRRRNRGCFYYGFITAVCLILMLLGGVLLLVVVGGRQFVKVLEENSELKAAELPVVVSTEAQIKSLTTRLDTFGEALEDEKAQPPEPLELTEEEVNQLIQSENQFKGIVYVDFEPDRIRGKLSLPLDLFARLSSVLKGRYINGEAEFSLKITSQGLLDAHLEDIKLSNGKDLPIEVKVELRRENLAKEINQDVDVVKIIKKLDRIEILKDKIRLVPLRKKAADQVKAVPGPIPSGDEFEKAVDAFKEDAKQK